MYLQFAFLVNAVFAIVLSDDASEFSGYGQDMFEDNDGIEDQDWNYETNFEKEPSSYFLEYTGLKETVQDMFEEEEIGGVYWKSGKDENNETYYKKEDPTRFLSRKVVGRWTISKYLNNHTYVMFQTLYNETSDWIVYLAYMDSFEEISGIVLRQKNVFFPVSFNTSKVVIVVLELFC